MDLLGSILGSMEKPPENMERKKAREQKAAIDKLQQQEKLKLNQFRSKIQKRISDFVKDGGLKNYKFEPMDKNCRAIAHEVAEVAGLTSFSFGQDEIDRYVMVWKKEYAPCDEEVLAYRSGQTWDPESAARLKEALLEEKTLSEEKKKNDQPVPQNDYHRKYDRLLAKDRVAQVSTINQSYGFVSSDNKRDRRTIEEVMAENKAKKRPRTDAADSTH